MDDLACDLFGIVGTTVSGAYEVEAVVAEGGFAVVYRARHRGFSAPVALKCLKLPKRLSPERQELFLAQFRAEAELLFQLSAGIPSVVRPLHVDAMTLGDGTFVPFLVLEWLAGETLDAYVARRKREGRAPLTLKKLVRLLTPVARALERAHNFRGADGFVSVVHRDLKPENVFVAEVAGEEVVKILDFGIASAQSAVSQIDGPREPSAGSGFFSPPYAAPEQWLPKRYGQTGPWTDVWGLALTLVEALKGASVIDGDVKAMRAQALDEKRRPTPRAHGIDVPDAVEALFARALALEPKERPADAGVFWDELTRALGMRFDDRMRDRRSEAGSVPREERIGGRHASALAARRAPLARPSAEIDEQSQSRVRAAERVDPDSSATVPVSRPIPDLESRDGAPAKVSRAPELPPPASVEPEPQPEPPPVDAPPIELELGLSSMPPPRAEPRRVLTAQVHGAPLWDGSASRARPAPAPSFVPGIGLIVAAIVVGLADRWLLEPRGIALGPVSGTLVAALCLFVGVALIIHRLLPRDRG